MEATAVMKRCSNCGRICRVGVTGIERTVVLCDTCARVARSTQGDAIEPGEPYYEPIKARQDQKKGRTK